MFKLQQPIFTLWPNPSWWRQHIQFDRIYSF